MKFRVRILPHYFEAIKAGEKTFEYYNVEEIVFINSETDEEIMYRIKQTEIHLGEKIEEDVLDRLI